MATKVVIAMLLGVLKNPQKLVRSWHNQGEAEGHGIRSCIRIVVPLLLAWDSYFEAMTCYENATHCDTTHPTHHVCILRILHLEGELHWFPISTFHMEPVRVLLPWPPWRRSVQLNCTDSFGHDNISVPVPRMGGNSNNWDIASHRNQN